MEAFETTEFDNGVVLELHYDPEPFNPREDFDQIGTILADRLARAGTP